MNIHPCIGCVACGSPAMTKRSLQHPGLDYVDLYNNNDNKQNWCHADQRNDLVKYETDKLMENKL